MFSSSAAAVKKQDSVGGQRATKKDGLVWGESCNAQKWSYSSSILLEPEPRAYTLFHEQATFFRSHLRLEL